MIRSKTFLCTDQEACYIVWETWVQQDRDSAEYALLHRVHRAMLNDWAVRLKIEID